MKETIPQTDGMTRVGHAVKRLIDRNAYINDLNIFLDTVMHNTRYGKWYFGSLHEDRAISDNLICVFEEVHRVG